MLYRGNNLLHRAACEKTYHANFFFVYAINGLQIILLALPLRKNFKNVIRFEIGTWEGGKKIRQTSRQTDGSS